MQQSLDLTATVRAANDTVQAIDVLTSSLELMMGYIQNAAKNASVSKTTAYSAVPADSVVNCNTSSGTFAVMLPNIGAAGNRITINWSAGTIAPTVAFATGAALDAGQVINFGNNPGAAASITFEYDGNGVYTAE